MGGGLCAKPLYGERMFSKRERISRKTLKTLGVKQSLGIRFGPYFILFFILIISICFFLLDIWEITSIEWKTLLTPIVTVFALLLAYHQWKHLRNEVSISGSLERLDIVNSYFKNPENDKIIKYYFGQDPTWDKGIENREEWGKRIYIFMELDNLQYALEKYRLGYSSAYQAMRIVDVFAADVKVKHFWMPLKNWYYLNMDLILEKPVLWFLI